MHARVTKTTGCLLGLALLWALLWTGCGGEGVKDDPGCDQLSQADKEEAYLALEPVVWMLQDAEQQVPGLSFTIDEQAMTAVLTYSDFAHEDSPVVINGQIDLANQIAGERATLTMAGQLSLSGGLLSSLGLDLTLRLPWDPDEGDFAGEPTSIEGWLSLDGTQCGADNFPGLFGLGGDGDGEAHFIAAGMQGTLMLSEDGSAWEDVLEPDDLGTDADLYGIACDPDGTCLAVGGQGVVLTGGPDGEWQLDGMVGGDQLQDVAVCDGTWLAVGSAGAVHSSQDGGQSWTSLDVPTPADLLGVACAADHFVIVGAGGTVLVGSPATSFDLVDPAPVPVSLQAVSTDGMGVWLTVGDGGNVLRSGDDGASWTVVDVGLLEHFSHVAYGQGRFIAVGQGGLGWGLPAVLMTSDDGGLSFTRRDLPDGFDQLDPPRPLGAVATDGQGRWSAAGNGGDHLLSTDNGDTWEVIRLDYYGLFDIAYRP